MDTRVVLDANVYVETNYARSSKFSSLVDFLRRSNNHLILLSSVLEEVLAKCERDFRERAEAAKRAVKDASGYSFTAKRPVLLQSDPDFSKEREALRKSLKHGAKGVIVDYVENLSGVDALEVVRRGAQRIPPADLNGEELRDVIHWLAVLSYAKQVKARILVVTRDKGFWTKDGKPREEILQDIKNVSQDIVLFNDIETLLRQNSLSTKTLGAGEAANLFPIPEIEKAAITRVGRLLERMFLDDLVWAFKSGRVASSEFQSGTVFKVGEGTEFVEANFLLRVETELEHMPRLFSPGGSKVGRAVPLSTLLGGREPTRRIEIFVTVALSTRVTGGKPETPEIEGISWLKSEQAIGLQQEQTGGTGLRAES